MSYGYFDDEAREYVITRPDTPWINYLGQEDYFAMVSNTAREPYVYAQMIAGPDAPTFGEAKNSWLTSTAAWNLVAITQWILGVRPGYDGLIVDPCIPKDWPGFRVTRSYRGAKYVIEVRNEEHVCRGVKQIIVDGKPVEGNVLPVFNDGAMHSVTVVMGG